jgi:ADP-heptose:LPS heptosyltransferase
MTTELILKQWQAPGDLVVMTIALRDLHLSYPTLFKTEVVSCYPEIFYNSPYQSKVNENSSSVEIWYKEQRKKLIHGGFHFSDAFIASFNNKLSLKILKTTIWPEIYLTDDEKDPDYLKKFNIKKPYWVLNAGIKNDIPLKQYPPFFWQKVINYLNNEKNKFGASIVQCGSTAAINPQFDGVIDLVGSTKNIRDYFVIMYHSNGSMGHVSLHMHVAAAFRKPCIIIAGGRESFRWESYPGQSFFDVIGRLDCAKEIGCWLEFPSECMKLTKSGVPLCYTLISPESIVTEVLKYHCYLGDEGV